MSRNSLAAYLRRLVTAALRRKVRAVDPTAVFNLGRSEDSDISRDRDAPIAEVFGRPSSDDPEASALIDRAARLLGESLVGVVAFGSWVRDESRAASDFDVLLIAEERVPITRELYQRWDGEPALRWRGHEVEPHFVHLPREGAVPSGTWAEVATDGVVLLERGRTVSERLADIRRMISAGRISRRFIHGQPYWVRAR